jgi:uncharacterized membrane protein
MDDIDDTLTAEEKQMAMIAHILGPIAGFLGPLAILLIKGEESAFVKYHATQSLILQAVYMAVIFIFVLPLAICTFGMGTFLIFPLIPLIWVAEIWAALEANKGRWVGFPGVANTGLPPDRLTG